MNNKLDDIEQSLNNINFNHHGKKEEDHLIKNDVNSNNNNYIDSIHEDYLKKIKLFSLLKNFVLGKKKNRKFKIKLKEKERIA